MQPLFIELPRKGVLGNRQLPVRDVPGYLKEKKA
jgi:hypothetical protein